MKSAIKSILLAGAIAAVLLTFAIRAVAPSLPRVVGSPAVEQTRSFSWPGAQHFALVNNDGTVRIWSHQNAQIAIEAAVRIYATQTGNALAATEYANALFDVTTDDDVVRIVTEPAERPDFLEMRVDYDVFVPVGTDVEVVSANGNVHVAAGCGSVAVQGRNADIYVKQPKGMVTAQTTNGRINVVDAPEGAELKTVNGNIYAHLRGGKVKADTTNGLIVAHLLDADIESAELNSMNGGITLVMNERCSGMVDARTMHGGIRSDFAIDTSSGVQRRHHLRGDIGSGQALLNMRTLNGNIWLARGR